jgi:CRP-like cAMP-binding protein
MRKQYFTITTYNKGEVLIEYNKPQDRLFQILSGSCCQYGSADDGQGDDLVRLSKGSIFGEGSFLIGSRSSDRVVVRSAECQVAYLKRSRLLELCRLAVDKQDRSLCITLVGFFRFLSKQIRQRFLQAEDSALEKSGTEIVFEYVDEDDNPVNSRDVVDGADGSNEDDDDDEDDDEEEVIYVVENEHGQMIQVTEAELHLYQ